MDIGSTIKELRKEIGLSQIQLAKMVGYSQSEIASWERNESEPNVKAIKKLAKVLNCSCDYLLGEPVLY